MKSQTDSKIKSILISRNKRKVYLQTEDSTLYSVIIQSIDLLEFKSSRFSHATRPYDSVVQAVPIFERPKNGKVVKTLKSICLAN